MATNDELRCMATITSNLLGIHDQLAAHAVNRAVEQEAVELLDLIPQVLSTDPHPGRISALLFQVDPPPLLAAYRLTHPHLSLSLKLRAVAVRTMMQIFSTAMSPESVDYLAPRLTEAIRELHLLPALVQAIAEGSPQLDGLAAAEFLFLIVMQLPTLRDEVARGGPAMGQAAAIYGDSPPPIAPSAANDGYFTPHPSAGSSSGIGVLLARLREADFPEMRSFVCATLRVLAETHGDCLVAPEWKLLPYAIATLREHVAMVSTKSADGGSSPSAIMQQQGIQADTNIVTLLLECLTDIFANFPSIYLSQIVGQTGLLRDLVDAVFGLLFGTGGGGEKEGTGYISHSLAEGLVTAALNLIKEAIIIEGCSNLPILTGAPLDGSTSAVVKNSVGAGFFGVMSSSRGWQRALQAAARDPSHRHQLLRLQRQTVVSATAHQHVANLERPFMEAFPTLCVLLNPEKSDRDCMLESALLVALMAAKSPNCRSEMMQMVHGYEAWAANLRGSILNCLVRAAATQPHFFRDIWVVDSLQCVLNDGSQLMHLENVDVKAIASAIFLEQERRLMTGAPLAPLRTDLWGPASPARSSQVAALSAKLGAAVLDHAITLALTPHIARPAGASTNASRVDAVGGKIRSLSRTVGGDSGTNQATRSFSLGIGDSPVPPVTPNLSGAPQYTPRRSGTPTRAAAGSAGRSRTPHAFHVGASPHSVIAPNPQQQSQERITAAMKFFGETPTKKTPFRPSSPASTMKGTTLATSAARNSLKAPMAVFAGHGHHDGSPCSHPRPLLEAVQVTPGHSDEYVTMAIMMHLPITYGAHYNRANRGAIRKIESPSGSYVQHVHRNTTHSWSALDVHEGDLYVLFVPFHKMTVERLEEELDAVERHLVSIKKKIVTTPQQQRSRRWFLHDMLNYVLPKTELLLRDMYQLAKQFGADNLVYQMGIIRLLDESQREKEDVIAAALEGADAAMPHELLRFSSGKLKDVLHSGNISYAVRRLREHFFQQRKLVADEADPAFTGGTVPSQLAEVDREIARLEQQAARDVWGREGEAELADDVEPAYDPVLEAQSRQEKQQKLIREARERMTDPAIYISRDHDSVEAVPSVFSAQGAMAHAPQSATQHTSAARLSAETFTDADISTLPEHLRRQFEAGIGAAPSVVSGYEGPAVRGGGPPGTKGTPTMADFDDMYAKAEQAYVK